MRFSVILPSHNGADRIRTALNSIKEQTFKDYELIVVCDACSDLTADIAQAYGATVLTVPYRRCGLARNDAIARAQGEYLIFIDDDDCFLHEFVFDQIDKKLKEQNPDVLCFSFLFKGWKYSTCKDESGHYWTAVWTKCWKRSFVKDCKFSDDVRGSDVVFTRQVLSKNPKIVEWDMPLYAYTHMREGSITETYFRGKQK